MEGNVGKFTAKRGTIHRKTDAVEPFLHFDGILAHTLADDIEWDLVVRKRAAGDSRENGHRFIPRKLVAREVETLAGETTGVLEDANGNRPDVCDGNLREGSGRRECRRVNPFSKLLFYEIEVLHEGYGRENRCADADFGDVLLYLILAVEMRNARLSVGGADRSENKMHACCLGRVGGCNTLSCLGVCAARRRRHREERGRSFEGLRERRSVFERRGNERRPGTRERLGLA